MTPSLSSSVKRAGVQGALLAVAPVPAMLAYLDVTGPMPPMWRLAVASAAGVSWVVCAALLLRHPHVAGILGGVAALCSFLAAWPHLVNDPFAALLGLVGLISAAFALIDFRPGLVTGKGTGFDRSRASGTMGGDDRRGHYRVLHHHFRRNSLLSSFTLPSPHPL